MSDSVKNIRTNVYLNDKNASKTLRQLHNEARKYRNELQHMKRGSKEFEATKKNYKAVRREISKVNRDLRGVNKGMSGLGNNVNKYFNPAIAGIAALSSALLTVKKYIDTSANLSDLRADVQKVTNLTDQQIDRLQGKLDSLNTRTARAELLDLAKQGGKMGKETVEELTRFVDESNQILVALGEDLGDDAVLQIGKMADIFDESMLKIGSGINAVADNSKANAGFLTDWLARLAGTSKEVGIAAGDVLGYGATLDELGLKVEMSSTALNRFLIDFTKNTEQMGEAAGFAKGELSELIGREGSNEGFLQFLQRLREGTSTSDEFLQKLQEIGVNGSRGSQVFLALSQNIDQVRERQMLANREIALGTSITNEYNRKNENLAGNLAFIGRKLHGLFFTARANNWLTEMTSRAREYLTVPVSERLRDEQIELKMLGAELNNTNTSQERRQEILEQLQSQYPDYLGHLDLEKSTQEEITTAIQETNTAMIQHIALQQQEEEIASAGARIARSERARAAAMVRLKREIAKIIDDQKELNEILANDESAIEFARKMSEASGAGRVGRGASGIQAVPAYIRRLQSAVNDYMLATQALERSEADLNEQMEMKQALMQRLGKSLEDFESKTKNNTKAQKEQAQAQNEASAAATEENEKYIQKRLEAEIKIQDFLAGLSDDEAEKLKQKFSKMLALAEEYGIDRKELQAALEKELQQLQLDQDQAAFEAEQKRQLELMESSMQQLFDYEKAELLSQDETRLMSKEQLDQALFDLEIKHLQRLLEARRALGQDTTEIEEKLARYQAENSKKTHKLRERDIELMTQQAFMTGMMADEEKSAGAVILDVIRRQITAEIARGIAKLLASVLGKGPLALVLGPALAAGASAMFNKLIPSFATGGYTGTGLGVPDPQRPGRYFAGLAHDNEYVVRQEELRRPDVQRMVSVIEDVRTGRHGGGAMTASGMSSTVTNNTQEINVQPLLEVSAALAQELKRLRENGVVAVADQRFRRDMEELEREDQFIKEKTEF